LSLCSFLGFLSILFSASMEHLHGKGIATDQSSKDLNCPSKIPKLILGGNNNVMCLDFVHTYPIIN